MTSLFSLVSFIIGDESYLKGLRIKTHKWCPERAPLGGVISLCLRGGWIIGFALGGDGDISGAYRFIPSRTSPRASPIAMDSHLEEALGIVLNKSGGIPFLDLYVAAVCGSRRCGYPMAHPPPAVLCHDDGPAQGKSCSPA